MADPFLLGGLALSGGGSLLGALAQNRQAELNNQIAALNYYEQSRANQAREALGREQLDLAKAPVVSGTGTRSEYIPGRGFVTTLSPEERTIVGGNLQRMIREGPGEEARREYESGQAFGRRLESGGLLDALLSRFDDPSSVTNRSALGALRLGSRASNQGAYDPIISSLAQRAVATGDIGAGRALGETLQQLAESNRRVAPTALDAGQIVRGQRQQDQASNANLIQLLAGLSAPNLSRAGPIPIPQDATTATMQRMIPQAAGVAANTIRPSIHDQLNVSLGWPNALNASASALFGIGQMNQAQKEREELMEILSNRQIGNA